VIWGAAATRHPWRGAAKPASLPVYPPKSLSDSGQRG